MHIFFPLRISATPILVLTTESAILNTPTKGTDVFAHLATLEKTARKVNVSRINTNLNNSIDLLTTAAEERAIDNACCKKQTGRGVNQEKLLALVRSPPALVLDLITKNPPKPALRGCLSKNRPLNFA